MNANTQTACDRPHDDRKGPAKKLDAELLGYACWLPFIAFLALAGFATVARVRVGHWPYYSNPDPKDLDLPLLHAAALLSYPIALVSIPACLFVVILAWNSMKRRDVFMVMLGVALWAFILPITGPLFEWLID